jgi:hypothetical protein
MLRLFAAVVFVITTLSGCEPAAFVDNMVPKEESRQAQELVAKIAARDFAAVEAVLDPSMRTPNLQVELEQMANLVPAGNPKSVHVVGFQRVNNPGATTYSLMLEYEYPTAWLVASVQSERRDGKFILQGANFLPRGQSMSSERLLNFDGKGLLHFVFFALAIVIPLFVLYTLVLCIRTKFARRKWMWVLFVAVGWMQCHLNWSTGAIDVQPLSVMLLGSGMLKSGPMAPWVITVTVPMGAILFLLRRRKLKREAALSLGEQNDLSSPA